ncbi:MAG: hypothetical protein PHQ05_11715 [Sterolibacterium sp.]|nr:hypothetical protein [Sterolibacterium sp.]
MKRWGLTAIFLLSISPPAWAADESGVTYGSGSNRFPLATGSPAAPGTS